MFRKAKAFNSPSTSQDFSDKLQSLLDSVISFILFIVAMSYGLLMILTMKVDGEFSGFLVYILSPLLLCFGFYGIIRIWNKRKFIQITTGLSKEKNRQVLINFLKFRKYEIIKQNENLILVIEEESTSVDDLWTEHTYFKIADNSIFFNIQKHYPFINPPVFFSHLFLKWDLKSFISKELKPT